MESFIQRMYNIISILTGIELIKVYVYNSITLVAYVYIDSFHQWFYKKSRATFMDQLVITWVYHLRSSPALALVLLVSLTVVGVLLGAV